MMAALVRFQTQDGSWRQLIDHAESFPESSGTGMFSYALTTGLRRGWLDAATYIAPARRAWIALAGFADQNADAQTVAKVLVNSIRWTTTCCESGRRATFTGRQHSCGRRTLCCVRTGRRSGSCLAVRLSSCATLFARFHNERLCSPCAVEKFCLVPLPLIGRENHQVLSGDRRKALTDRVNTAFPLFGNVVRVDIRAGRLGPSGDVSTAGTPNGVFVP